MFFHIFKRKKKRKLRDFSTPMPPDGFCGLCGEKEESSSDCELCEVYTYDCKKCVCKEGKKCPCCIVSVCICS